MPEAMPLAGLRILVTRPKEQAEPLLRRLRALGATPLAFPAIRIEPRRDLSSLDTALAGLHTYDWVVFTSANAVDITWERLRGLGLPGEGFGGRRLAAIGPATAEALARRGLRASLVPEVFIAEGVAEALGEVAGLRILLPRAEGARAVLPETLSRRGARVDEIPLYRAVPADPDPRALAWLKRGLDVLTFTSPSTVRGFVHIVTQDGLDPLHLRGDPLCACIGPITAQTAMEAGFQPAIRAERYTGDGLVSALVAHFDSRMDHGPDLD